MVSPIDLKEECKHAIGPLSKGTWELLAEEASLPREIEGTGSMGKKTKAGYHEPRRAEGAAASISKGSPAWGPVLPEV